MPIFESVLQFTCSPACLTSPHAQCPRWRAKRAVTAAARSTFDSAYRVQERADPGRGRLSSLPCALRSSACQIRTWSGASAAGLRWPLPSLPESRTVRSLCAIASPSLPAIQRSVLNFGHAPRPTCPHPVLFRFALIVTTHSVEAVAEAADRWNVGAFAHAGQLSRGQLRR